MQKDSDEDGSERSATNNCDGKSMAVLQVEVFLLQTPREAGNIMSSKFSHKAHHVKVYEKTVHFWRKG